MIRTLVTASILFGLIVISTWVVTEYNSVSPDVVEASTPEPTTVATPEQPSIYPDIVEYLVDTVGITMIELPELFTLFEIEDLNGQAATLVIDGDRWHCEFPSGDSIDLAKMCQHESSVEVETQVDLSASSETHDGYTVVKRDMDKYWVPGLDGVWIWHQTDKHTWVSLATSNVGTKTVAVGRADGSTYRANITNFPVSEKNWIFKCPNSTVGNKDKMLRECQGVNVPGSLMNYYKGN